MYSFNFFYLNLFFLFRMTEESEQKLNVEQTTNLLKAEIEQLKQKVQCTEMSSSQVYIPIQMLRVKFIFKIDTYIYIYIYIY